MNLLYHNMICNLLEIQNLLVTSRGFYTLPSITMHYEMVQDNKIYPINIVIYVNYDYIVSEDVSIYIYDINKNSCRHFKYNRKINGDIPLSPLYRNTITEFYHSAFKIDIIRKINRVMFLISTQVIQPRHLLEYCERVDLRY